MNIKYANCYIECAKLIRKLCEDDARNGGTGGGPLAACLITVSVACLSAGIPLEDVVNKVKEAYSDPSGED